MAGWDNGQPRARFDPYAPQPDPESTFGPHDADEGPAEADLWDFDPDIKLPNDAYRGIRRASADRPYRGRRVGLVVGIVVAVAAVALFIAIRPDGDTGDQAAGGDASALASSDHGAGPTTSQLSATAGPTTGVPVSASPVSVAAFAPLTFEAEAGPPSVKRRGADVETLAGASGGKVVRFMDESGQLEIRGVDFTGAGTYRITVYYATGAAGMAAVSIPNVAPLTVSFAGQSACCAAGAVDVALPAGQRTVTISGVTSGVAIDRVVITRVRP